MKNLFGLILVFVLLLTVFSCNKEENNVTPQRESINIDVYGCAVSTPELVNLTITYEVDGLVKSDNVSFMTQVVTIDDVASGIMLPLLYHKTIQVYKYQPVKVSIVQGNLMNSALQLRAYLNNNGYESVLFLKDGQQFSMRLTDSIYKPIELFEL
jgi:hypothetical protein